MRRLNKINSILGICAVAGSLGSLAYVGSGNAGPESTAPEPLEDTVCLRKVALDLTHRGPTAEELERIKSGTSTLADMADEYMGSEEFESVVFDWYRAKFPPTELTAEDTDVDEPARIAQHIVLADMDYRNILTGDFTIAPDGSMVDVADRPAAGVLSTPHYMSAYSGSFRRNWAGRFLGEWGGVILEAVSLPPDTDEADLTPSNLLENPACMGCHGDEVWGVDHLASFAQCYDPDGSYRGGDCTGSWLTVQGSGLQDLGRITADSKRFKAHVVNFFVQEFFGRHLAVEEADFYVAAQRVLDETDYNARALIKHIVTSDAYCAN